MTATIDVPAPAQVNDGPVREARVALALARVEGPRLLRHPLVILGLLFGTLNLFQPTDVVDLTEQSNGAPFACLSVAAMTLVASHLAVCRGRRHATEELFAATSAPARARTGAHLLAVAWPTAGATVLVLAYLAVNLSKDHYGSVLVAELVVGPVLVAGAGALGVLLGRLAPWALVPPVACIAIAAVQLYLGSPPFLHSPLRWMNFWVTAIEFPLMPRGPAGAHLVYLVGLVTLAALAALLFHGLGPRLMTAAVAAIALTVGAAVVQGRPIPASAWAQRNDLLVRPDAHQACQVRDDIRYCAFPDRRPLIDHWQPVVEGVRRAVPADRWPRMDVRQRVTALDLQYVADEARRHLGHVLPALPPAGASLPDDGDLHPRLAWGWNPSVEELGLAIPAASRAVALPMAPGPDRTLCDSAGQGRAVVALWLAAQALPEAEGSLRRLARDSVVDLPGRAGRYVLVEEGPMLHGGAAWAMEDVGYALTLLDRPAGEVRAALAAQWDRLTAPSATTGDVVSALGINGPTPIAGRQEVQEERSGPPVHLGAPCR